MAPTPLISVVIPARNEAEWLPRCLEALYRQRGVDPERVELIVVDNGSTDDTAAIGERFGARTITEPRAGVARARYAGFAAATAPLIASTDADTLVSPTWLRDLMQAFRSEPAIVAVGGPVRYDLTDPLLRKLFDQAIPLLHQLDRLIHDGQGHLVGSNFAVRRAAYLASGGFDRRRMLGEDLDLAHRLQAVGTVRFLPNLTVVTSDRRFRSEGPTTIWRYFLNYLEVTRPDESMRHQLRRLWREYQRATKQAKPLVLKRRSPAPWRSVGRRSSRALIAIHGFSGHPEEMRFVGEGIASALDATLVLPTIPGHATEPADLERTTRLIWYQAIEAVFDQVATTHQEVIVLGNSFGGNLALKLARHRPVTAVVGVSIPHLTLRQQLQLQVLIALNRPFRRMWRKPTNGPQATEQIPGYTQRCYEQIPIRALDELLHFSLDFMRPEYLAEVTQPTLIVTPRSDPFVHPSAAKYFHRHVASPAKQLLVWDEPYHLIVQGERKADLVTTISDWLTRQLRADRPTDSSTTRRT